MILRDGEADVESVLIAGTATESTEATALFDGILWATLDRPEEVFIDFFAGDHTGSAESQFLRIPSSQMATIEGPGQTVDLARLDAQRPRDDLLGPTMSYEGLRVYNIGACSVEIGWRALFSQLETALTPALQAIAATDDSSPEGDLIDEIRTGPGVITLSPLMRLPQSADGARIRVPLTVIGNPFGEVRFHLIVEVDLTVVNQTLVAQTSLVDSDDVSSQVWADIGLAFRDTTATELIDEQLAIAAFLVNQQLAGILQQNNPLNIPVKRVHVRPESVEVVVAESPDDPNYAVFNSAGICTRPQQNLARIGYKGALFQFTRSRPDPPWFVE